MGYRYRGPRAYRRRWWPLRFLWLLFFLPVVYSQSMVTFGVMLIIGIAVFIIIRAASSSSYSGMNTPPVNVPPQQTYQPYQPLQPYEQGYQPYQPAASNQQDIQKNQPVQYDPTQYEEQPQAQYPEELPPMVQ
jgi:ABC-type lipoprotein release transport system permease subunit